jgi:hypothetical protein
MAMNYTKCPQNIPNGHKIFQHLPFKGPPKFTQIGIFGLKTNHLATLHLLREWVLGGYSSFTLFYFT